MSELLVGASKVNITPEPGLPLAGNPVDRPGCAEGTRSPLFCRCLYLRTPENQEFVLYSLDLLGVDLPFSRRIREDLKKEMRVPPENVMVVATHTHSGPDGILERFRLGGASQVNDDLISMIEARSLSAAILARDRAAAAKPYYAEGEVRGIGANRRHPDGPVDNHLRLLTFTKDGRTPETGNVIASVINYACHPTLGNFECFYSADFPGYATDLMERRLGQDAIVLFTNGAAGDVSTRFTRLCLGDSEARRMGGILGTQCLDLMYQSRFIPIETIKSVKRNVSLRCRKLPNYDEISKILSCAENKLRETVQQGHAGGRLRTVQIEVVGAKMLLQLRNTITSHTIETEFQVWVTPELLLITVPGEMFASTAEKFRERFPARTLIIGYANDYVGYLVPAEEFTQGGYEALTCVVDPTEIPRIEDIVVECIREATT